MANLFRCGGGRSEASYQNLMDQLIEETASGAIVSFTDGANNIPVKSLVAQIEPVQEGTGDPSPSNVRPITGHTELNLVHTGKNLLKPIALSETEFNNNYRYKRNVIPNARCVMSFTDKDTTVDMSGISFGFVDSNWNDTQSLNSNEYRWIISNGTVQGITKNIPSSRDESIFLTGLIAYPRDESTWKKIWSRYNIQIELGSSATAYEEYNGGTDTIDFGQTVFGGTLNVTTGELTVTHTIKTCKWSDGVSSADLGSYIRRRFPFSSSNFGKYPPTSLDYIMCDKAPYLYNFNSDTLHFYYNSNDVLLFMPEDTDGDTLIRVTFELATPITIQLTPTEIKTLLGANNFYHDCNGDTDVTYRANGALYVQEHPITRGLMAARPTEQIQEQEEQQEEKEINKSEDNER